MSERTLAPTHVTAMREARAALCDAASRGDRAEIEAAIRACVDATRSADFSPQTVSSLVAAALESALPSGRGAARRAQRTADIDRWAALAWRLAGD